jgi:hypothetical protein
VSAEHSRQFVYALTLAEHRALNPSRPVTDSPIGGQTAGKRDNDAHASSLFGETGWFTPGNLRALRTAKAREAGRLEKERIRGLEKNALYRARQRQLRTIQGEP